MKLLLAILACAAIAQAIEERIPGTRTYTFSTTCEPHDGGKGGSSISHHEYVVSTFAANWHDAEAACVAQGGHLASIHDADTQAAITAAAGIESVWIGMHDAGVEGIFEWSDGTCANYEYWAPGEPNEMGGEDCVEISVGLSGWNDLSCTALLKFVCQLPYDSSTTGVTSSSGSGSTGYSTGHSSSGSGSTGYSTGHSSSGSGSTGYSSGTTGHSGSGSYSGTTGSSVVDYPNLFVNADFTDCPALPHNTPPTNWGGSSTSVGVDCDYWHTGIDPGYPSGAGAPRTQWDNVEGITQTVPTAIASLYYVSFWVAGNGGVAEIRYGDKDGSLIASAAVTNYWTQVTGTFVASGASAALFIGTDLQSSTGATGDARISLACVSLGPCPTDMPSIVATPAAFISESASKETLLDGTVPTFAASVEKMETKAAASDATIAYLAVGVPVAGLALVAVVVIKTRRSAYAPVSSIEL